MIEKLIDVEGARAAIRDVAVATPVLDVPALAERARANVILKLENLQVTGSFKVRGAANKMLSLSAEERGRGVIACSSGNHGRAVAYVAESLDVPATICVPEWVDPVKLAAMRRHGADVVLHGQTYDEAEERSYEIQKERDLTYVHPFDQPEIIAGQGTIGLELLDQFPSLDTVVVPLSGGGLIAGIALALKSRDQSIRVIGVSAVNARVMYESLQAGRPISFPEDPTVANALSGGIGLENRLSFSLVRDYVDDHVLVSEEEIRAAMGFAALECKTIVEGGGAVGIAALLSDKLASAGRSVAVVVSGGNVDSRILTEIVVEAGRA